MIRLVLTALFLVGLQRTPVTETVGQASSSWGRFDYSTPMTALRLSRDNSKFPSPPLQSAPGEECEFPTRPGSLQPAKASLLLDGLDRGFSRGLEFVTGVPLRQSRLLGCLQAHVI